jgi:hypothetical protein
MKRDQKPKGFEPGKGKPDEPLKRRSLIGAFKEAARDAIVRRTSTKR